MKAEGAARRAVTCHWISTNSFTVLVKTDGAEIVWTAPLVKRFFGQPVGHLLNWAIPFGGLRHESWPVEAKKAL